MTITFTRLAGAAALLLAGAAQAQFTDAQLAAMDHGKLLFETYCGACHGTPDSHAPLPSALRALSPERVLSALNEGVMQSQAQSLSAKDRQEVAEYLTAKTLGQGTHGANIPACASNAFDAAQPAVPREWGFDLHNTRYQSLADAGLQSGDLDRLEVAWSIVLPGAIQLRSQPTFAGGWLFMGSQDGTVYALDAKSGCLHWEYHAISEVRTTISVAPWAASDRDPHPLAVFGDHVGNVYAVDARSGKQAWKVRPHPHINAQITGSPRILGDRVLVPIASHEDQSAARPDYPCCTSRGAVAALDLASGATRWISYSVTSESKLTRVTDAGVQRFGPSGASIWNSPAIDLERNQLYVGTGDNYSEPATGTSDAVIAMDLTTGAHKWVYQATQGGDIWNTACLKTMRGPNCPVPEGPDFDIGAGIVLTATRDGRPIVLAGQKSSDAIALDPATGKEVWRRRMGRGGNQGGIHFGMAAADGIAYIPVSDMVFELDMATYDRDPRPGLFAVDLANGKELWGWTPAADACKGKGDFCDPGIAAPPTIIGDRVLAGALDGVLRIHDRASGKVTWSMDTTRDFTGINGVTGHGGSMNAIGPVAHDGTVYVASGYAFALHMPGNVFLALRPHSR